MAVMKKENELARSKTIALTDSQWKFLERSGNRSASVRALVSAEMTNKETKELSHENS